MTILLRQRPLHRLVQGIVRRDNGLWFDPEDMSTMFQDAAGTTPVTALEQPVGLWLDKSQGLELGPELVPNGDFSNGATGWSTYAATLSTTSGGLSITPTVVSGNAAWGYASIPTVAGKLYTITAMQVSATSITYIRACNDANLPWINLVSGLYTAGAIGIKSISFKATQTTTYIMLGVDSASTTNTVIWDDVSVRELKGNRATQSITGYRPTLSARYNWLLNSASLSTQSVPTSAAQYTLSFTGTGSVTMSGSATGTLVGTGVNNRVSLPFTATAGTLTLTVSGSVTLAMLAFGALTEYQAITTSTSYDSVGWPRYLRFDGIDDYLNLPYMGLYANGSASVVSARDAVLQAVDTYILSERSATDADTKYFPSRQLANGGNMDSYIVSNDGTVRLDTTGSAFSGAKLAVIRSAVDSGSNIKLFKDGAVAADDNYTRAGVLTPTNTTLGASVSTTTSNYANMRLYGLIVTKSALSDTDRKRCERYLARKLNPLGVTLV